MADMLVKLYNMPYLHDREENLFKSGIRIKKALLSNLSLVQIECSCQSFPFMWPV